jgi:AcrR family transcriptional regulator
MRKASVLGKARALRPREGAAKAAGARQQERSVVTRAALLKAARYIFARDGFEASRIEDIAAHAGRSRGAFYANFESKEEAFFALREEQVLDYQRDMQRRLKPDSSLEERRAALEEYALERVLDRSQLLLQLEFKLYALRHPELRRQLAARHLASTCKAKAIEEIRDLFPNAEHQADICRRSLALQGVLEGLALNLAFSPETMNKEFLKEQLPHLLRAVQEEVR